MARQRLLGAALVALSVAALAMSFVATTTQMTYTRCQAAVNDALIHAQRDRADAAQQDREALDRLVTDVLAATDRTKSRQALQDYVNARAAADAQRAAHPIPDPPSSTCG